MSKSLVVIGGPTGVGKSEIAVELALRIEGEIVSGDSMQVYRGMDIGSAKITHEEMKGVRHHLIDVLDPQESCSIALFQKMALQAIEDIHSRGHIPILVGGTGFYIRSILYGTKFEEEDRDMKLRRELEDLAVQIGPQALHLRLHEVDPDAAAAIPPGNVKRVIRALEFYQKTGKTISSHNREQRQNEKLFRSVFFALTDDRHLLYQRINERVDRMIRQGLPEEVRSLMQAGCRPDMVSMHGIGYRQMFSFLDGSCSLEETAEQIKKESRHYAKRQLTWLRREEDVFWIHRGEKTQEEILSYMIRVLRQEEIIGENIL